MSLKMKIDMTEFLKLRHLKSNRIVGVIKKTERATINDQAWTVRKFAQKKVIPGMMTTRGKFNQRTIRVTPARGRSMEAETGNISFKKYMGLKNLELGKSESNISIPHEKEVRGGNRRKKVTPSKRLKNLNITNISSSGQLRTFSNRLTKGYFRIVGKSTKLRPGIYSFKGKAKKNRYGNRRSIVWWRDETQKKTTPKKKQWLKKSTNKGISPGITNRNYKRNAEHFITKELNNFFK